jgi:phosphomannomutase/phosphoglucomutase
MITSLSGIRGILNQDMTLDDVFRFAWNFGNFTGSDEVLLGRDSRSTGPAMSRAVAAAILSGGTRVADCEIISTPALFRESRGRRKPAVMVTASHNEPEFNGLKFIVEGMGIGKDTFDAVVGAKRGKRGQPRFGTMKKAPRPTYVDDLVSRFGAGSCEGVRVAIDLGGGAAISQSPQVLKRLGCEVLSINDAYGVFNRKVDPVADNLVVLRKLVKEKGCDVGMAFDCDGDRLVIVDARGRKKSGDYMLTLALSEMLEPGEKVAVSLDTTNAVDDVVGKAGGEVFRSKVGEANVVATMKEKGVKLGGEGSSGGLIDGAFNYCRDSMLAAIVIIGGLRKKGHKFYDSVPSYHQERLALTIPREKAQKALRSLAKKYDEADTTDGVKVSLAKHEWVLVRPSGTEDLVRVSAEAETSARAGRMARTFAAKMKELSR